MAASEHVQPQCRREDALAVVQVLQRTGHTAYFAGGCVRDMLWNLTPKDFDVATDAPPQRVRELFPRSQGVGQAFGVVLVRQSQSIIEVATFRADGSYSDGRRPDDVRFATPQEDAQRRDFTINGVFFDPVANQVIDFVNGQADIQRRILRAIGDPATRFAEDYLRMLRAVRFTSRFNLNLDDQTAAAIRANAHKLPRIAPERICDELRATFATTNTALSMHLLDELGLTPVLLRGIVNDPLPTVRRQLASSQEPTPFALRLVLFALEPLLAGGETVGSLFSTERVHALTRRLRQLFRLSNEETNEIAVTLQAGTFLNGELPRVAALKRYLAQPASPLGLRLLDALSTLDLSSLRIAELKDMVRSFPPDAIAPPPFVDGTDLQAQGYSPGPAFKRVLDSVYDAQLELRISDRDAALAMAKSLMDAAPDQ